MIPDGSGLKGAGKDTHLLGAGGLRGLRGGSSLGSLLGGGSLGGGLGHCGSAMNTTTGAHGESRGHTLAHEVKRHKIGRGGMPYKRRKVVM